eukprot:4970770-Alexandrium_andersonii.AAC.1
MPIGAAPTHDQEGAAPQVIGMPPRMQEHVGFPTPPATPPPESAFVAYRAEQASKRTHPAGAAPG